MPERRFADSYEMNIKKIHNSIMHQILNNEKYDLFNPEDEAREQALENRINNIMAIDERFKSDFNGDMQCAMVMASYNGFENGLRIGLSLLQNLLTAELPEIYVIKHQPDTTERRFKPVHQQSDVDPVFIDYINKVCPYLNNEQKSIIQSRIEQIIYDNMEKLNNLF